MSKMENPLWDFALAFYGRPGIAPACLSLQDLAGVDVVQIIAVVFADIVLGRPLAVKEIGTLEEQMVDWRASTVLPLRKIRRRLKPARSDVPEVEKEGLRIQVKAAELLAEQVQLAICHRWLVDRRAAGGETLSLGDALRLLAGAGGSQHATGGQAETTDAAIGAIVAAASAMRSAPV